MLTIVEDDESYLMIEMRYYSDTEVLVFVKKWLPFIVIVDNDHLRDILKKILNASLESYK